MVEFGLEWIKSAPIAHRGLHDVSKGVFENTLSAVKSAVDHGYHIEVDLHPSLDKIPMVFHDNILDRLTTEKGPFRSHNAAALQAISIAGTHDQIPTLQQLLELVAGKVGIVLELKGIVGEDDGFVENVLNVLEGYIGPVAIMSFNHWLLADARKLQTNLPLGLTGEGDDRLYELHKQASQDFDVDFVSYGILDLPNRFVKEFRQGGGPVITWTIKTPELAEQSALYADQITFEGYLA